MLLAVVSRGRDRRKSRRSHKCHEGGTEGTGLLMLAAQRPVHYDKINSAAGLPRAAR